MIVEFEKPTYTIFMSDTSSFNISILVSTEGGPISAEQFTVDATVQSAQGIGAASENAL